MGRILADAPSSCSSDSSLSLTGQFACSAPLEIDRERSSWHVLAGRNAASSEPHYETLFAVRENEGGGHKSLPAVMGRGQAEPFRSSARVVFAGFRWEAA